MMLDDTRFPMSASGLRLPALDTESLRWGQLTSSSIRPDCISEPPRINASLVRPFILDSGTLLKQ